MDRACPRIVLALAMGLAVAGCQTALAPAPAECPGDPDAEVMALRKAWEAAPAHRLYAGGCDPCACGPAGRSKELIRRQAENLLFRYPRHVPTRMFAALLAYETGDARRAIEHLDAVRDIQPVHPDAVALRARIALEQNNILFARQLLEEQVTLRPDHAGLHEALASIYYLEGEDEKGVAALDVAERLGSPRFRLHYNRGLIEENRGNEDVAVAFYRKSLALLPGWPPPISRLRGLGKDVNSCRPRHAGPTQPPPPPPPPPPRETVRVTGVAPLGNAPTGR